LSITFIITWTSYHLSYLRLSAVFVFHFYCCIIPTISFVRSSEITTPLSRVSISSLYSFLFSLTFHTGGLAWIVLSFLQIHFSFFSLSVFAFLCFWLCLDEFLDYVETNHTLSLFFCGETKTVLSVNKDIDNNLFWVWRLPCYDILSLTCLCLFAKLLILIYNRTKWISCKYKMQKVNFKLQLQDGVICFCVTTRSCMKACEARLCWIRIEATKQRNRNKTAGPLLLYLCKHWK
jgi:hypothetical protein